MLYDLSPPPLLDLSPLEQHLLLQAERNGVPERDRSRTALDSAPGNDIDRDPIDRVRALFDLDVVTALEKLHRLDLITLADQRWWSSPGRGSLVAYLLNRLELARMVRQEVEGEKRTVMLEDLAREIPKLIQEAYALSVPVTKKPHQSYAIDRAQTIAELRAKWPISCPRIQMIGMAKRVLDDQYGWSGCEGEFMDGGQQLAALSLREAMSDLSELYNCSSWDMGIPEQHWEWLRGGDAKNAAKYSVQLANIRKLAEVSGWWWADHDLAVPLDHWAEKRGKLPESLCSIFENVLDVSICSDDAHGHFRSAEGPIFVLPIKIEAATRDLVMKVISETWPVAGFEVEDQPEDNRVSLWVEYGDSILQILFEAHQTTLVAQTSDPGTRELCRKIIQAVKAAVPVDPVEVL